MASVSPEWGGNAGVYGAVSFQPRIFSLTCRCSFAMIAAVRWNHPSRNPRSDQKGKSMRAIGSLILIVGALFLCRPATAQTSIPLPSLTHLTYSYSALADTSGLSGQAATASPQPNHPGPLTHKGKMMRGAGIALVGVGATVIAFDALFTNCSGIGCGGHPGRSAAGFIGGGGIAAAGVTLIVLGNHRRETQ